MSLEERISQVLKANKLTVISTTDRLKPESALIAFAENDKLELFFQTSKNTRKYKNLTDNGSVSFVIGFGWENVQYEGVAKIIDDGQELEAVKQLFDAKDSPTTRYYLELPETVIFKVTPAWIGYRNYNEHPPIVEELTL